jgi:predicted DCC family thiol-disulfide oxidoreductase YuxK
MQTEWVFYDGECGFCHRWVRLAVRLDRDGSTFRFAPRKGETFRALVAQDQREALPASILVLTRKGRILTRSSAVLHILEKLGGGWRVIAVVARLLRWGSGISCTESSLMCGMGFCPSRNRRAL